MSSKRKSPRMPPPSEAMKRWSAVLAEELGNWSGVTTRPMFGMRAVYRTGVIFAMLPDKRSVESPDGIAYKEGGKWKIFEVVDEGGLACAVAVLEKAYELAAGRRR